MTRHGLIKPLIRIIVVGSQILCRAFQKAILEEIEISQQAAHIRYSDKFLEGGTNTTKLDITLDEAMQILDVNKLETEEVKKRYNYLFKANQRSNGGSFYILSKIVRAKKRIDSEFKKKLEEKV
ncbi:hypothetical protein ILUMI_02851 [Ignelater luminosus]|uniref:Mitochondrial import inner membrane translocase subunit Tim16 n=1 Tax=Ignelater luminosus TaxID=2038154 RepID=A0A8K0DMZ1_IGNLU|nr:hypothetical protein ILUMI_02851 [Ignelater luminosus]